MEEYPESPALDAALIAAAPAVEHTKIAWYSTLKRWAEKLGHADAAQLLYETLQEEGQTDKDLTELVENGVNTIAQAAEKMNNYGIWRP